MTELSNKTAYRRHPEDLTGKQFGRLQVMGFDHKNKHGQHLWLCRCECGTEKAILGYNLKNSHTVSCGCFNKEVNAQRCSKHGQTKHPNYKTWKGMLDRCTNQARKD
ncbi:MAG TPA: hypothetical protein VFS17_09835, partial [Methylophilaceae bacterium]|nr:hypothetical protein [Methylophilaceae bacterium]